MTKKVTDTNCLAFTNPELTSEWHPTKNGALSPFDVTRGSKLKVWWKCSNGHEWQAYIFNRSRGISCPYCSGHIAIPGINDLVTIKPELAEEWHPTKNGILTPQKTKPQSNKKVWWLGKCGHEWQEQVSNRYNGNGCPYCSGQKALLGFNDLRTVNPDLAKEWHPTKNGSLTPEMFTDGTDKKVWWLGKCGHEWKCSIGARSRGHGCPYCKGHQVLVGINDLATTNPSLAEEWHPTKNYPLTPQDIKEHSNKKYWWLGKCGHEWQEQANNRSSGNGCPYCAGRKVIKGFNDLQTVNPELASEWHPTKNGTLTPDTVTSGAEIMVWWLGKCGHEWQSLIYSRKRGNGCPYCRGLKILRGFNDLASVEPALVAEWHPTKNGGLTPYDVTSRTTKKVWWKCEYGHEWQATVASRSNGHGCPICSRRFHTSFPEQTIFYYIKKLYSDAINGYRDIFDRTMELDIYIPSIKTAIEYDGIAWHKDTKKTKSDAIKYKICQEHNIHLIRVQESQETNNIECCDNSILLCPDPDFVQLDAMLIELFCILDGSINDISVERDYNEIMESYHFAIHQNSLSSRYPDIASQWHPTLNGNLTPEMFPARSNSHAWWQCDKGHTWKATLNDRVAGNGCPYCTNQKVLAGYNDLATKNPSLASEWHPSLNGELTPSMVTSGTDRKVWWICKEGHEWQASIGARNRRKTGCPVCARNARKKYHSKT